MSNKKLFAKIFKNPINRAIHWSDIEKLLIKIEGVEVVEVKGSAVHFIKGDEVLSIHRPHPKKEALHYRIKLVREFLINIDEA